MPCTAAVLAVTVSEMVAAVEETPHVTFESGLLHVVYPVAVPVWTFIGTVTVCPLWTITGVSWRVVTCVARENVAVRDSDPSVPVTTSGYVPPGVLVVLVSVSVAVAEPPGLRDTCDDG